VGLGLEIKGIKESIDNEEYDQAAFRAFLAILTFKATVHAWKTAACFTEETLIYTKDGHKSIKDIEVGDKVYAWDSATGEIGLQRVKEIFVRETSVLVHLVIDGIEIETTPEHPFWVRRKGWVSARKLQIGDNVSLYSGETGKITSIQQEVLTSTLSVYNFEVEAWHTYFVSESGILVHNACNLKFGDHDLVYGPSAGGKLRNLQQTAGGKMLVDMGSPIDYGFSGSDQWFDLSKMMIEHTHRQGNIIHFDLTYVENLEDVLTGAFKPNATTSRELIYIKNNWSRLSKTVIFYLNGSKVSAPW
jgi:hypothetical protein